MNPLLKKLKKLEIKINRMVNTTFAGEFKSAFKGTGLEFDEVREYQFGDDIRTIDWNVTAKAQKAYIKVFREERELNVFVLFDVSGSEYFGPTEESKIQIGMELTTILAFSALKNNDKFGLATFSDQIEEYFKPMKGKKHTMAMISHLMSLKPKSKKTSIKTALEFLFKTQKKKSLVFIISDFIDEDYEENLKLLHKKHDISLIRLFHPNEILGQVPGIVPVLESESNQIHWIKPDKTNHLGNYFGFLNDKLESFCKKYQIGYVNINTMEDYVPVLEKYFHKKSKLKH